MHCDLSGFGGTHSYCSQLVSEVASGERMALLGVPSSRIAVPVSDTDEVALCESAACPQEYESDNRVGDSSLERVVCTEGYVFPDQWTRTCFSYNAAAGDASSRYVVLDGEVLATRVQERRQ